MDFRQVETSSESFVNNKNDIEEYPKIIQCGNCYSTDKLTIRSNLKYGYYHIECFKCNELMINFEYA